MKEISQEMDMWIDILKREVAAKGPKQVATELGVSRASVDLLCTGKYPADPANMVEKIKTIYGVNGRITCPILGDIAPLRCAETWKRARSIGMKAGNPETVRLYITCMNCSVRNGK